MKALNMVGMILVVVGALNWGLVGLGWLAGSQNWNLVHLIFGFSTTLEALIYVLVGLAGVWSLVMWAKMGNKMAAPAM